MTRGGAYAATKHAVVAVAEQTAIALADSNISVTLLCPALVRTAMSVVGDDPDDVARIALTALRSGRFLVAPEEWSNAIAERGSRLVGGGLPTPRQGSCP
ncbi:SDR family NAD(P)-dependent oxidoreductase [Nocardioides astragali]|uniref:SDR family NAD(P)-dependent oxidoreductase n=1 Tax=Nocardioides astragali TaxID=1776736 RepID=A0ABW2N4G8_9ACTN|nr:SDR family NAD(P)-dependent oxidoreductase [Nocardioides astragali]